MRGFRIGWSWIWHSAFRRAFEDAKDCRKKEWIEMQDILTSWLAWWRTRLWYSGLVNARLTSVYLSIYLCIHEVRGIYLFTPVSILAYTYIQWVGTQTPPSSSEFPLGYAKDDIRLKQLPRILSVHLGVYMNAGREEFRSKLFKVSCTSK